MATSPLGGFADLSSYRRLVDAQKAKNADGLNNLIQNYIEGAQQGNVMVNLPEILQQQNEARRNKALSDQIALQLSQIELEGARNPNLSLDRAIRSKLALESISPGTGVSVMPTGLEGQIIAQPGAITPEQQALLVSSDQAGIPIEIPTAQASAPITPIISPTGAPTGFSRDLNRALAETIEMSRIKDAGTPEKSVEVSPGGTIGTFRGGKFTASFTAPSKEARSSLEFKDVGDAIVGLNSSTGEEISRTPKKQQAQYEKTAVGLLEILPDGTKQIVAGTQPSGGKGTKLSEDERKGLVSAASQVQALPEILKAYDELSKSGKTGVVGGSIQRGAQFLGMGGEDFAQTNARIMGNLFSLARALQGGGVLTEKDIERMEALIQPLNVERGQFVGGLRGVAQLMVDRLRGFKQIRGNALDEETKKSVDEAERNLMEFSQGKSMGQTSIAPGTVVRQGGKTYQFDGKNYIEVK